MNQKENIGIMQPYFFPYLGYFQLINESEKFIIYERVSYRKKSWITKNRILDKGNGESKFIQLPLKKISSNKLISEIEIDNSQDWRMKILNLLYFNYKKAPYFDEVYSILESCINHKSDKLHDYNTEIIKRLCAYIHIDTAIISDNAYAIPIERDLEARALNNQLQKKTQRIIDLCQFHKIQNYLNPINGIELYKKEDFNRMGYSLNFIEMTPFIYNQFNQPFTSHLSIIDVLFHIGKEKTIVSLNNFKIH